MEVALCLQFVAVVDGQATFTDTSNRISMQLIVGSVLVKVAWRSKAATN